MSKTVDVYRDWLGIQEAARPLNHYQLLRLKRFEDDPSKIREHYRKMNTHVRKYAAGEFAKQSQDLLNELAKAMLCLTDSRRKREYDASQGRKDTGDERRRTLEELLLSQNVIDSDQLEKARKFASVVGVDLRDAVLQQKLARADAVMPAYAESIGLPYIDLQDIRIDESLVRRVPAQIARQHSCAPVMIDDNQLLMASPNPIDPNVEEELRLRFGMAVRTVLCTPGAIHQLVNKHYSREAAEAEMAADPAQQATPTTMQPTTGTAQQPASQAAKQPAQPETPEERSMRVKVSLMSGNFGVVAVMMAASAIGKMGWGALGIAIPVALLVAGTVWTVMGAKHK